MDLNASAGPRNGAPRSLSVCCLTRDPAAQVAEVLAALRPLASEIVVALDARVSGRELRAWHGVADRLLRVELSGWPEQAMSWMHAQCSGDWILRVDGDELFDAAFVAELPKLIEARDVAQYWLARRWLHPDPGHWLDAWPWAPDYQCRLYRNDALLWFSGRLHTSAEPVFPRRYLEHGLYHLEPLLRTQAERLAKVEHYTRLMGGRDEDLMHRFYLLPEGDRASLQKVPAADHEAIGRVLAARPRRSLRRRAAPIPLISSAEILSHWAGRSLSESDYACRLEPADRYERIAAGDQRPFRVRVQNLGGTTWPGGPERLPLIALGARWLDEAGEPLAGEVPRVPLPAPLAPGEATLVRAGLFAPQAPGRYQVEFELIHEHVRWFGQPSAPVAMLVEADETIRR